MSNNDEHKAGGVPADVSRRQILKGLAAVPAIATLGAASQAAAASITACEANSTATGGAPLPSNVQNVDSGANTYFCETSSGSSMLPDGFVEDIDDPIGNTLVNSEIYDNAQGDAALADSSSNGRCVVYAKLNADGKFDLTFDANSGANPVAASCLASIGILNRTG